MALPHGPLGPETAHLCIDVQRLFAEPGEWHVPGLPGILRHVAALARHRPERTVFTRFVVPETADHAVGAWVRYYRRWGAFTGERLDPELIGLAGEFASLVPPAAVIDKPGYSAFGPPDLHQLLAAQGISTLVVTGVETDVCVLSSVMQAIDLGYRVVLAADALASSSQAAHEAAMAHVYPRFDQQVEIADTATILQAWR
jgi:nicotinamidase-related amidase